MIRVHHLNASRSHRILWLLEELGLTYEIVPYQRDPKTMLAPKALRAIHPLGKSPVVEEDGRIYAESGAIIELMIDKHSKPGASSLAPPRGTPAYERYLYWLHYAEGSAMPPLLLKLVLGKMGPLGWPAQPYVNRQLKLHFDYLEGELTKSTWFAGEDFSGADIALSFAVEAGLSRVAGARPKLQAFVERIHARPAWKRAEQRGGTLEFIG